MKQNRKRLKRKRHSCPLCKPHKMGWANRWTAKERRDRAAAAEAVRL